MKTLPLTAAAAIAATAIASTASADVVTQTRFYDWSLPAGPATLTFNQFDDQGGDRVLEAIRMRFDGDVAMEVVVENYGTDSFESGEWFLEATHSVVAFFQDGGPTVGLGGIALDGITGDLGAGSGSPFGAPGDPVVIESFGDTVSVDRDIDGGFFDYFSGDGSVSALMAAFSDFLVTPPANGNAIISAFSNEASHNGVVTLEYEFSVIPAPAAGLLLAGLGFAGRRRRLG